MPDEEVKIILKGQDFATPHFKKVSAEADALAKKGVQASGLMTTGFNKTGLAIGGMGRLLGQTSGSFTHFGQIAGTAIHNVQMALEQGLNPALLAVGVGVGVVLPALNKLGEKYDEILNKVAGKIGKTGIALLAPELDRILKDLESGKGFEAFPEGKRQATAEARAKAVTQRIEEQRKALNALQREEQLTGDDTLSRQIAATKDALLDVDKILGRLSDRNPLDPLLVSQIDLIASLKTLKAEEEERVHVMEEVKAIEEEVLAFEKERDEALQALTKTQEKWIETEVAAIEEEARAFDEFMDDREQRIRDVQELESRAAAEHAERIAIWERERSATLGAQQAFKEMGEESEKWGVATHDAILLATGALASHGTEALLDYADGTKTAKEAVRDFAKSAVRDINRVIIQTLILKSIEGGISRLGGFKKTPLAGGNPESFNYYAAGGAFSRGDVIPFAGGGVVGGPTFFPMSHGRVGLMGEKPPGEAILPLRRGPGGRLGVEAVGGAGGGITIQVNFNHSFVSPREERAFFERNGEAIAQGVVSKLEQSPTFGDFLRRNVA